MQELEGKAAVTRTEHWCSNAVNTVEEALNRYGDPGLVQGTVKQSLREQESDYCSTYNVLKEDIVLVGDPPPNWARGAAHRSDSGTVPCGTAEESSPTLEGGAGGSSSSSPSNRGEPEKHEKSQAAAFPLEGPSGIEGSPAHSRTSDINVDLLAAQVQLTEEGDPQENPPALSDRMDAFLKRGEETITQFASFTQSVRAEANKSVAELKRTIKDTEEATQSVRTEANKSIAELKRAVKETQEAKTELKNECGVFAKVVVDLKGATTKIVRFADSLEKKGGSVPDVSTTMEAADTFKESIAKMKEMAAELDKTASAATIVSKVSFFDLNRLHPSTFDRQFGLTNI